MAPRAYEVKGPERWQTSPAVKALYEKARAEGEVVLWGPQDRELDWIPAEFAKRFPGIQVTWSADRAANTKIVTEHRAGRYAVDVFTFSLGGMLPLADRRMLGTSDWLIWSADSQSVLLGGSAAALYNLVYSVVYDETLEKPADLPKTWDDLLAPRWKGKLVASQFLLPRLLGFLALEWGEARAAEYARALVDRQDTLITRAPRELILQRGERLLGVGEFVSASMYWKASLGLPIGWAPMPIMPAAQFAVATLARSPHPNAAKLLAGWIARRARAVRSPAARGRSRTSRCLQHTSLLRAESRFRFARLRARGCGGTAVPPHSRAPACRLQLPDPRSRALRDHHVAWFPRRALPVGTMAMARARIRDDLCGLHERAACRGARLDQRVWQPAAVACDARQSPRPTPSLAAARRAAVKSGYPAARADAARDWRPRAARRRDDRLRHPRSGGGARDGRSRSRDGGRATRSGRHAGGPLCTPRRARGGRLFSDRAT